MSQNNIPKSIPSVERLINRIAVAERAQQKDVRITIQEAKELTQDLAMLTVKMATTVKEVHQMLLNIQESNTKVEVKFDGGGFN